LASIRQLAKGQPIARAVGAAWGEHFMRGATCGIIYL